MSLFAGSFRRGVYGRKFSDSNHLACFTHRKMTRIDAGKSYETINVRFNRFPAIIVTQPVDHIPKTASRGRSEITRQCGQVYIDLFGINLLGKLTKMNDKEGNSADVVL